MSRARLVAALAGAAVFAAVALVPAPAGLRVAPFDRYGQEIVSGNVPYRDFSLEYPPGALPPIALPALQAGSDDTTAFRATEALLGAVLVLAVAWLVRRASRRDYAVAVASVAAIPVLLGPVVYSRFDLWPALLTVVALAAIASGRRRAGGASLGVAVAAKLFPLALVVPLAVEARRHGGVRPAIKAGVVAAAVVVLPFTAVAPGGVRFALRQQLAHHVQIESVGGSLLAALGALGAHGYSTRFADGAWEIHGPGAGAVEVGFTIAGLAALAALWAFVWRRRATVDAVVASAAALALVLVASKVLSPQYLVWIVPLAVAAGGAAALGTAVLLAAAEVLTQVLYPSHYDALVALHGTEVALLVVRNVLLLAVAALLVAELSRRAGPRAA